jgi:two-component system, chemotaxis family, protein-glutamate methylesterase/glutaminase
MPLPAPARTTEPRIRVMVVDDSVVIRGLFARALEVANDVPDGRAAVAALGRTPVDVIVLDIEMPVMDGLTAIPLLLKVAPRVKILMASTLTQKNAKITLDALAAGATDFLLKPSSREMLGPASFNRDLLAKVRHLGSRTSRAWTVTPVSVRQASAAPAAKPLALRRAPMQAPHVIAIGSSTGGPQALLQVLSHLVPNARVPILITQHMPPTFTAILASNISRQCGAAAVEAEDGMTVEAGRIYVAPGNYHMTVDTAHVIRLNQGPQENFCRPSVDPMLRSLVDVYRGRILTVILTGMGQDGLHGCKAVVEAGGEVIAQDEATSVVWGMPGAVATAGLCTAVLPLAQIGPHLRPYAFG